jgi:hypothetical protein
MPYDESTNVSKGNADFIFRVELEYESRGFFIKDGNFLQYFATSHHKHGLLSIAVR